MFQTDEPPKRPGEVLMREYFEPMGLSQAAFARRIRWTWDRVNKLVSGKRSVTAETALVLAEALGTPPEFWMDIQRDWDLWLARRKRRPGKAVSSKVLP